MSSTSATTDAGARLLADYDRAAAATTEAQARAALLGALSALDEGAWLDCAQRCVLRGRADLAIAVLREASARFAQSASLAFALAGLYRSGGRDAETELLLRRVLAARPGDAAAALMLAELLRSAAKTAGAAQVLRACFHAQRQSPEILIRAMELLDDCERKADAAALAEEEIARGSIDPRIHAYAASYLIQLGEFATARERYRFAYAHSAQAAEWDVPFGLASAQRYVDKQHADFALFASCLARSDLSARARTTLLFALGKACDDVGDIAQASKHFGAANELARSLWPWSRKQFRRSIDARMQAPPIPARTVHNDAFVPVFIVGAPRSGTTLAAQLLSRRAQVCNRGESRWIWALSQKLPPGGNVGGRLLDALAREYELQTRQDDAGSARWFIDKQPLNLLHVGLIMALFPQARIVYCVRNARDTALSLWTQFFRETTYAFAYDFADIAALLQGCERVMAHWQKRHADSIRVLRYEQLAADPQTQIDALAQWLDLPRDDGEAGGSESAIGTASVWQARQPVYTRSIGRWRAYAEVLPELLQLPDR